LKYNDVREGSDIGQIGEKVPENLSFVIGLKISFWLHNLILIILITLEIKQLVLAVHLGY